MNFAALCLRLFSPLNKHFPRAESHDDGDSELIEVKHKPASCGLTAAQTIVPLASDPIPETHKEVRLRDDRGLFGSLSSLGNQHAVSSWSILYAVVCKDSVLAPSVSICEWKNRERRMGWYAIGIVDLSPSPSVSFFVSGCFTTGWW